MTQPSSGPKHKTKILAWPLALALPLTVLWALVFVAQSAADEIDFVEQVRPIFERACYECHGEDVQESGLRLDIKSAALKGGFQYGPNVIPGDVAASHLLQVVNSDDPDLRMPPDGTLTKKERQILHDWIAQGAKWPDGVDTAKLENRLDHWSFQPLESQFEFSSIDQFIEARLVKEGLRLSPPADRRTWLRRVTFDLTGLPPQPDDVAAFLSDQSPDAKKKVVDRLLNSKRYGERWAQHWLDVVRYADTHGFEVNTERPNAWPYRDYVIRSFNEDKPYFDFIREQIAGDQLGADAATGFLVTASVLLPGQIGKDEASIRLARQDSLDEIVNNISLSFLGLSVGCARCHDHKFDPISARDYYSMQSFIAGVEYGDRPVASSSPEADLQQLTKVVNQLSVVNRKLLPLMPIARPNGTYQWTDHRKNEIQFAPTKARFVRFEIQDSNLHPTLGRIEPVIDEFEIWTHGSESVNVALGSYGTTVKASGSRTSDSHQLAFVNDGEYGNGRSWMSDQNGKGWLLFELPEEVEISKLVWGRDRTGAFQDRLPTSIRVEVGLEADHLALILETDPPRAMLSASETNLERLSDVTTTKLRFEVLDSGGLEPCIDELEVIDDAGRNVALPEFGTRLTTSGSQLVENQHSPEYLVDGKFGNSRSWLGNQVGAGWIEIEFDRPRKIRAIKWGRDRLGKLKDRLPVRYQISVERDGDWQVVADETDRLPFSKTLHDKGLVSLSLAGQVDDPESQKLIDQRRRLQAQKQKLLTPKLVFAGKFRTPDSIHLLRRGDPEQPLEEVPPAILAAFGEIEFSLEMRDSERRLALASWLTDKENPLTTRVMVNRIWQGHFGSGIVSTPSDFGRNGASPTHPLLLDWLARQFQLSGGSIKELHRMIVLSETYAQSSAIHSEGEETDSDVRLLWRFPTRRLDAESIRDSMLFVAGELETRMYGRGFRLFDKRGGLSGFDPIESLNNDNRRRMIYAHRVRRETDSVFGAFDCPDAGQSTAVRRSSTTPLQALNLFNSWFTLEISEAFARRVVQDVGGDQDQQIRRCYELAINRGPDENELAAVRPVVNEFGLEVLCRVLVNSNEFVFLP